MYLRMNCKEGSEWSGNVLEFFGILSPNFLVSIDERDWDDNLFAGTNTTAYTCRSEVV